MGATCPARLISMTATKLSLAFLVPVLALLITGCGDHGYTFSTTATYDIPPVGLRVDIQSVGSVETGQDLSGDGTSRILLSRIANPGVTVATLQTSNQVAGVSSGATITYAVGTNTPVTIPWGSPVAEESVRVILKAAGFTNDAPDAIDLAKAAIFYPELGPKSTPTGSATNFIVVKVTRNTKP